MRIANSSDERRLSRAKADIIMENSGAQPKSKILDFKLTSELFFRRGIAKRDDNDLVSAMLYYRRAYECEPDNEDIALAIAELLTEMDRYEESNRILMVLSGMSEETPSECYFGMGCNFFAMRDFRHARDSLNSYLDIDPEGEFALDAADMLDDVYDAAELEKSFCDLKQRHDDSQKALAEAERGRRQFEKDEFGLAIKSLNNALELNPQMHWARNQLSLAYFARHEYKQGIEEAEQVLACDGTNVDALCNLSMLKAISGDTPGASDAADRLIKLNATDPNDLARITMVLMELKRFPEAYPYAQELIRFFPYDAQTLHRCAVCAMEVKEYKKAAAIYDKLLRLDPADTIARYYRGVMRLALAGGEVRAPQQYEYQVPFEEMLTRVNKLNEFLKRPKDEIAALFLEGDALSSLITWGFTLHDVSIKRAMLALTATFSNAKAERIIRDFALRRDQPDELKREAFTHLKLMNAREPYYGYVRGELVESRFTRSKDSGSPIIKKAYMEVADIAASNMFTRSEECQQAARDIWSKYIETVRDSSPALTKSQTMAMAAALDFLACRETGTDTSRTEICRQYGVSAVRLDNALKKIERVQK